MYTLDSSWLDLDCTMMIDLFISNFLFDRASYMIVSTFIQMIIQNLPMYTAAYIHRYPVHQL